MKFLMSLSVLLSFAAANGADNINPAPKIGPPVDVLDPQIQALMTRFGDNIDDALFRAIGHYSFGMPIIGDFGLKISPERMPPIYNTKLSKPGEPIFNIVDQGTLDLGIDTSLGSFASLGPGVGLSFGAHGGAVLSHIYPDKNPEAKPEAGVRDYVEVSKADRDEYEKALQVGWLEKFLREEKLGFEYVFRGIDWLVLKISKPFWSKEDEVMHQRDEDRYTNAMNSFRVLFSMPLMSAKLMASDKVKPGEMFAFSHYGQLSLGPGYGNGALSVGISGSYSGVFQTIVLKKDNGMVKFRAMFQGTPALSILSAELNWDWHPFGGLLKNLRLHINPVQFYPFNTGKVRAYETVWEFDTKTVEGLKALDQALHGFVFSLKKTAEACESKCAKFEYERLTKKPVSSSHESVNFILAGAERAGKSELAVTNTSFADGTESDLVTAKSQLITSGFSKPPFKKKNFTKVISMSAAERLNAVKDSPKGATRVSIKFLMTNNRTKSEEAIKDLDMVSRMSLGLLKYPRDWKYTGVTRINGGIEFSEAALNRIVGQDINAVWSALGRTLQLKNRNGKYVPLARLWATPEGRRSFYDQIDEADHHGVDPMRAQCASEPWTGNQLRPCRGIWIRAKNLIGHFEKLQHSAEAEQRMQEFREIFDYNGFNPVVSQTMLLLAKVHDGDKEIYPGVSAQLTIDGSDLPHKVVHQPFDPLPVFDPYNPDETDFLSNIGNGMDNDLNSQFIFGDPT